MTLVSDTTDIEPQLQSFMTSIMGYVGKMASDSPEGTTVAEDELNSDLESASSEGEADSAEVEEHDDVEDIVETSCATKPEMVTARQREQLKKEGYKIIGTHSAVKLCRWTKHQLRGRGGCYKHTFYGITSYACMEATPSLACANKCVFCWRHHKNPVGKTWRWKMDEPDVIVQEAIDKHVAMIKEVKGVPGIQAERWRDAHTVRHCALSLVGEPIMYPRINDLLTELHTRKISTFLVTNAQFPEEMRTLVPVTQLYVSIDAATQSELKRIDRPLHEDFWERYNDSLDNLRKSRQRSVYRLTLVKAYNMEEAVQYGQLIERNCPDFIEIKAVTYCGKSAGSDLTMQNVPWHEEVRSFAAAILDGNPVLRDTYEFACEHRHSCCLLVANKRFKISGRWHTWIDYQKFHQLVERRESFGALDYAAPTPDWAVWGADEEGFDPQDQRHFRNKKGAQ